MEKKLYKVFNVDVCFTDYAANEVLIGAESIEDLKNHFEEIYPDTEYKIEDEYDLEEYPNTKIGDIVKVPYFTKEQLEEIFDNRGHWKRVNEVDFLFTDKPYVILDSFGYME